MRRALASLLVLALPAAAAAQPPRTKWGVVTGGRVPTGDLGSRYGLGYVIGFESSYMPFRIGLAWSLQFAFFWNRSDPRNVDTLQLIDLDLAVRGRIPVSAAFPLFLWAQAGVDMVRSTVPLEPSLDSGFIGPMFGAGVELAAWSPLVLSVTADYAYLGDGPSGFRALVSIALASH